MDNSQLYLMNNGLNRFYYPNNPNQYNSRGAKNINNNSSINLRKKKYQKSLI